MSTITEIENAVTALSMAEKYELFRFLAGQLQPGSTASNVTKQHGVLDIPTVQLAPVLQSWIDDDDPLEQMLEERS